MDSFSVLAHYFDSLPLYPVFTTVHFVITAIALRKEPGGLRFAYRHPIASCVITFAVASSGGILANLSLAKPPVACLLEPKLLFTCVIVWYLVFFSPLDVFFALCHFTPFNLLLWILKELSRAKKVYSGIVMAAAVYPNSMLAMAMVGMLKGSGKQWGITWYRVFTNSKLTHKHELLEVSTTTKSSFALAILLAYNHVYPAISHTYVVFIGGCFLATLKVWNVLRSRNVDPFVSLQNLVWLILTTFSVEHPDRELDQTAMETTSKEETKKTETTDKEETKKTEDGKLKND